jgi:hypothetical protein
MKKAAFALKLPQSLKTAAQRLAREDGHHSINGSRLLSLKRLAQ